jgi:hypothetical protein
LIERIDPVDRKPPTIPTVHISLPKVCGVDLPGHD